MSRIEIVEYQNPDFPDLVATDNQMYFAKVYFNGSLRVMGNFIAVIFHLLGKSLNDDSAIIERYLSGRVLEFTLTEWKAQWL